MQYNLRYDVIRCLAIVFVILIHSMEPFDSALAEGVIGGPFYLGFKGLMSVIGTGVPLFVMLSGALLLGKQGEGLGEFYRRRLSRVLIPFFFWSPIVYGIKYIQTGGHSPIEFCITFVEKTFGQGVYGIYWYIYLIIGLYLITPLLRVIVQQSRPLALYATALPFLLYAMTLVLPDFALPDRFNCENLLWIGYFLFGYTANHFFRDIKKARLYSLIIFSICMMTMIAFRIYGISFPFIPIVSMSLFMLLLTLDIQEDKLNFDINNKSLIFNTLQGGGKMLKLNELRSVPFSFHVHQYNS